jgi:hypothetical protein
LSPIFLPRTSNLSFLIVMRCTLFQVSSPTVGPTLAYSANTAAGTGQMAMLMKPYSAGKLYFLIR